MARMNLLLVLSFPDDDMDEDPDPDTLADVLVSMLNEDRQRNADDAGQPDYYKPLLVNAIPSPQWVSGSDLALLVQSIHLLQQAKRFAEEGR